MTSKQLTTKHLMILCIIILYTVPSFAQEPQVETINFEESDEIFPNPERGFYRHSILNRLTNLTDLRNDSRTLIYGKIAADAFRGEDFSLKFLDVIQTGFNVARQAGMKVIPAVAYNNRSGADDAPKEQILHHIDQLTNFRY